MSFCWPHSLCKWNGPIAVISMQWIVLSNYANEDRKSDLLFFFSLNRTVNDMVHCSSFPDAVKFTFHSWCLNNQGPWIAGVYRTRCRPYIWPLFLAHMESLYCHWSGTIDLKIKSESIELNIDRPLSLICMVYVRQLRGSLPSCLAYDV